MGHKNRSELREIIMQALYQIDIYEGKKMEYNLEEIIKDILETENEFVNSTIEGVLESKNELDELANKHMTDWTVDRIGSTDRAILRLGIYELIKTDTPPIVVINEAVELAKKYSDDKVVGIINSVLDKIYHERSQNEW